MKRFLVGLLYSLTLTVAIIFISSGIVKDYSLFRIIGGTLSGAFGIWTYFMINKEK